MSKYEKLLMKILSAASDQNVTFAELCSLLEQLGFEKRTKGGHHIYTKKGVEEIINLQPKGSKAKPYQVKQVRNLLLTNRLIK